MTAYSARLAAADDAAGWRALARRLLSHGVEPQQVEWSVGEAASLFDGQDAAALAPGPQAARVPKAFPALAGRVLLHRDPARFALCYALAWRLQHDASLLQRLTDPQVQRAQGLAREVARDLHKMKAFVRFRERTDDDGQKLFIAWFEPSHHILRAVAPFFVRRFASQRFAILTPQGALSWDGAAVVFSDGSDRRAVPAKDAGEDLWKLYYAAIFNPARLKVKAMQSQMPRRYWANLPEAELIPALIAGARGREGAMLARAVNPRSARRRPAPALPRPDDAAGLDAQIATCRRCPLAACATQAVGGQGPPQAAIMLVGEQPGDEEDLRGVPFVGPAGQLLDAALTQAGLERAQLYLTNAVKHFKFVPRGHRRIHQTPNAAEVAACADWLRREIALVRPAVIVALGATALAALGGRGVPVAEARGAAFAHPSGAVIVPSWHPAALLRQPDAAMVRTMRKQLVEDLQRAAALSADRTGKGRAAISA